MNNYGYSHNLHIVLVDKQDNILKNAELMAEIYAEIADKSIQRKVRFLGKDIDMFMYWKKVAIVDFDRNFIGDLCTTPIHSDAALYKLTTNVLWEIEQIIKMRRPVSAAAEEDWKIMFHISKFLEPFPSSFGEHKNAHIV